MNITWDDDWKYEKVLLKKVKKWPDGHTMVQQESSTYYFPKVLDCIARRVKAAQ